MGARVLLLNRRRAAAAISAAAAWRSLAAVALMQLVEVFTRTRAREIRLFASARGVGSSRRRVAWTAARVVARHRLKNAARVAPLDPAERQRRGEGAGSFGDICYSSS